MQLANIFANASIVAIKAIQQNKEKILLGTGLAAGLGTVILASKGTLDAKKAIEEHKENKKDIQEAADGSEEYRNSQEYKNDNLKEVVLTGSKILKAYAPSIVMGATSVCCILGHSKMMYAKVNHLEETVASLSAAYIAVDTAFKQYRKRVVDKYGEKEDRYFRYGETTDTIEVTDIDEKGKVKKHKETKTTVDDDISGYAKFFDATCAEFLFQDPMKYKPDWEANINFLQLQESYANGKLEREGYLFLNDVYDMLGIPRTQAGQVVGWIFNPEDKTIDSHVSFGIFNPINHLTINGYEEECILLDFNVDGVIVDKIPTFAEK